MLSLHCTRYVYSFLIVHARVHKIFQNKKSLRFPEKKSKIKKIRKTKKHCKNNIKAQMQPSLSFTLLCLLKIQSWKWCQTVLIVPICSIFKLYIVNLAGLFEYFPTSIAIFNFFECHFCAVYSLVKTNFTNKQAIMKKRENIR